MSGVFTNQAFNLTANFFNTIACGSCAFLSHEGGGGLFGPHPRKQCCNYLIDLKSGTRNYWHKAFKNAKFRKFGCCVFGDMTS